ncbi:MAG: PAS domain-containing sensor histidine kinase [Methanoregula sp.]|jgi:PAS domain S-box-containing protein|nr:PAS domain-containing sensor histidine kinase [Methanoregula sp.]
MEPHVKISGYSVSHTDITRAIIVAALTLVCIVITTFSISQTLNTLYAQLFYFPIVYATYFYPKRGLYLAGACAVFYEIFAYFYIFPDTSGLILVTGQALLFICIAAVVAFFSEKINASETRSRTIVEKSQSGIILVDKNTLEIHLSNTHIEHMLGYTGEELAKMAFAQLFSNKEDQLTFFKDLDSGEDIKNIETVFITHDKGPVWVSLSGSRITDNLVSCTVIDINKFKLAQQALDEIDVQYKQVAENFPTCIIIIRNQMIVYTNPAFELFSGYKPEELMGTDPITLIFSEDHEDFRNSCRIAEARSSPPGRSEVGILIKSGKIRPATLFFTQIRQNGTPAILINLMDIPGQESLKEQIQHDSKRQRGIISTFAYELRTPLQPIMGYINMLTQDPDSYGVSDETKVILDRCAKSVDRERQIINQMLELSVIDAGNLPLEYSVFNINDLLISLIDAGGYRKSAQISMDVPTDLTFDADKTKISTVLDTMLSNAVNYSTHPRKIQIMYLSSPNDIMHRLCIKDNGIGITDSRLDEIFDPFPIADSAGKIQKFERIGLSLAIAKKYIKMHEGYISVDSIKNLETKFCIHIPKNKPVENENNGT